MSFRVLIWYWSASGGGGSYFAARLARKLGQAFGPEAISLSLLSHDPVLAEISGDTCFSVLAANVVSNRRDPVATLVDLSSAAEVLAQHARRADCVIVPMNFATAAPLSLAVKQPMVYCAHDPEPHEGDYAVVGQIASQALLLRRSSHVVALSHFAAERLRRTQSVARKLKTAPLGAVIEPAPAASPASGPVKLLFVGRMIAYKGLDILAEAIGALAPRRDWRLTVAGDGPALSVSVAARLGGPNVVRCERAWLRHAELQRLISECDVLVAPYRSATQSGIVAEALAHGKPCVVTPVGALPEQIGGGDAGWIAESVSGAAVAACLTQAIDNAAVRERKAKAALALARALHAGDHWGWLGEI